MDILVIYASVFGSTQEIADRVAGLLRMTGHRVHIRSAEDVRSISAYQVIIAGSAIHHGHWLSSATTFRRANREALTGKPIWLFSVSTLGDTDSAFRPFVATRLRAMRKEPPEVTEFRTIAQVKDHRNFAGVVESAHWPLFGRTVFRVCGGRCGDHRDWSDVESWAEGIAYSLLTV